MLLFLYQQIPKSGYMNLVCCIVIINNIVIFTIQTTLLIFSFGIAMILNTGQVPNFNLFPSSVLLSYYCIHEYVFMLDVYLKKNHANIFCQEIFEKKFVNYPKDFRNEFGSISQIERNLHYSSINSINFETPNILNWLANIND